MVKYDYIYFLINQKVYRIKLLDIFLNNKFITQKKYDGTIFAPQEFETSVNIEQIILSKTNQNNKYIYKDIAPKASVKLEKKDSYLILNPSGIVKYRIFLTPD